MNNKINVQTSFIDLLFILLMGFVTLFIISFILINPVAKTGIINKNEKYIVLLTWTDGNKNDFDLWLYTPTNEAIGFNNKSGNIAHLDRDDLGDETDFVIINGKRTFFAYNEESINIRNALFGKYYVNVFLYKQKQETYDSLRVKLINAKNGDVLFYKDLMGMKENQEVTAFTFYIDENGSLKDINTNEPFMFVKEQINKNND